ncbi:MAG: methionine ABC transporter substrate-binding protein [Acholeplasmatales bacterium]|jgi:D-methionine transport system substrate-binding protein|nr:methionine ABC transporter substrate-binding protein [Acholeplasmatales bacterium]
MKKVINFILVAVLILVASSCSKDEDTTIRVVATAIPHGEILEFAKPLLKEKGYTLEVDIVDSYTTPNPAVANGSADANFFQHIPYLNAFNDNPSTTIKLVNAAGIHIEPIGLYSPQGAKHRNSLSDIQTGDTILMSNSDADVARLLNLLHAAGLITVKNPGSLSTTESDILTNPKNLTISRNVDPDSLLVAYAAGEANLILINGNYALAGGLNPINDALYLESTTNNPYTNVLACTEASLNTPKIKALIEVLTSEAVKEFIRTTYNGSVIPSV